MNVKQAADKRKPSFIHHLVFKERGAARRGGLNISQDAQRRGDQTSLHTPTKKKSWKLPFKIFRQCCFMLTRHELKKGEDVCSLAGSQIWDWQQNQRGGPIEDAWPLPLRRPPHDFP